MKFRSKLVTVAVLTCAPFFRSLACCAFGRGGQPVQFAGQTNIVVWDKNRGVEHFVRDARFASRADSAGFLAPTPGRPELSEVDSRAFDLLVSLKPKEDTSEFEAFATASKSARSVEVVEVTHVAGYRATVLKANDAAALSSWLAENGYRSEKWTTEWLRPYVDRGWYLTAFQVELLPGQSGTGPVRLSFKTDRPFNPYSVPSANTGRSPLRLFYVSAGGEVPRIGGEKPWQGATWESSLPDEQRIRLAGYLRLASNQVPVGSTVAQYDDPNFSRPGQDDLYFVAKPLAERAAGPIAALLSTAAVLGLGVRISRERRSHRTTMS